VEPNIKYFLSILLRNEGTENEKIRMICPTTSHFSVKMESNPFIIAPGLSNKIIVYFNLEDGSDGSGGTFCDRVSFIGRSFKKEVELRAVKPVFKLKIPKFFNLGIVRLGKETRFEIQITNIGKEDAVLTTIHSSSTSIMVEDAKVVVKREGKGSIHIKVLRPSAGVIAEQLVMPNGETI
jgi:hypothetical protein